MSFSLKGQFYFGYFNSSAAGRRYLYTVFVVVQCIQFYIFEWSLFVQLKLIMLSTIYILWALVSKKEFWDLCSNEFQTSRLEEVSGRADIILHCSISKTRRFDRLLLIAECHYYLAWITFQHIFIKYNSTLFQSVNFRLLDKWHNKWRFERNPFDEQIVCVKGNHPWTPAVAATFVPCCGLLVIDTRTFLLPGP